MAAPVLLSPQVISSGVGALGSIGSTILNGVLNRSAMSDQVAASKELMKYQWEHFQSPKAQAQALAAAGINPAVALGQGGPGFSATPSPAMPTSVVPQIGGITDIADFVKAMAEAKKANVDTKNVEVDTQAKQFELELSRVWSNPEKVVNLVQSWKNVMLSNDAHSLNEWKIASEKALAGLKGIEKDTAQKVLDNMDIQIEQENRQREEGIKLTKEKQKTEGTMQSANRASAKASEAAAKNSEAQAYINEQEGRIRKVLADNESNPQVVRKKLETLFEELKAKKMSATTDAEKAFEEWRHVAYENDYFADKKYDAKVDYFLAWLRKRIGFISIP